MPLRPAVLAFLCSAAPSWAQVLDGPESELAKIELPVLATARERPEALWAFLTGVDTPYAEAQAAATRCRGVFPLRLLQPLYRARAELQSEHLVHWFGFAPPEHWSEAGMPRTDFARERHMLGREFTLPETKAPYPTTWAEAQQAPWPWRVMHVLDRTLQAIAPIGNEAELPRTREWFAECLRWPVGDDASAQLFADATIAAWHTKTLPVLARWRRIVLDPNTPQAAARIAGGLGEAHRQLLWGDADARLACQVVVADALQSPHLLVRQECAYQLRSLVKRCTFANATMTEDRGPLPVEALIGIAERAVSIPATASVSDRWNALYVDAFSVCEAIEKPPFSPDRHMRHDSPEVGVLLERFAEWWRREKPALETLARERAASVERLRAQLEQLAH